MPAFLSLPLDSEPQGRACASSARLLAADAALTRRLFEEICLATAADPAARPSAPIEKISIATITSITVRPRRFGMRGLSACLRRSATSETLQCHRRHAGQLQKKGQPFGPPQSRGRSRRGLSPPRVATILEVDQVQVIRPLADEAQVFAVRVCEADAVHVAGGPATAVAVTVTFCEGEKPCAEPLPEKYVPELSAA